MKNNDRNFLLPLTVVIIMIIGLGAIVLLGQREPDRTVADIISQKENLDALVSAAAKADLLTTLDSQSTAITIFAPTNEAFDAFPGYTEILNNEDTTQLTELMEDHILAGQYTREILVSLEEVQTISGKTLNVTVDRDQIRVGEALIIEEGTLVGNSMVYVVDKVLEPTEVEEDVTTEATE